MGYLKQQKSLVPFVGVLLWSAGMVMLETPVAWSDDTAKEVETILPPDPGLGIKTDSSAMYRCLTGQVTTAVGDVGTQLLEDGGVTGDGSNGLACPPIGTVVDKIKCSDIKSGAGVNFNLVDAIKKTNEQSLKGYQCEARAIGKVNTELNCLQQTASALSSQLATVGQEYQKNIQKMQTDVKTLESIVEDRNTQLEDTTKKLGGDKANGAGGLLAVQQSTRELISKMPADVSKMEGFFKQIDDQKKALTETIQTQKIALAAECFEKRPQSGFKVSNKEAPTSAMNYLLGRYYQNMFLGQDGKTVETGQAKTETAKRKQADLKTLLTKIFGDAPTQTKVPNDPNQAVGFATQNVGVLSVEDIERQFGKELKSFNANGIDVYKFVMSATGSCYRSAERQVNREKVRASSQIGRIESSIKSLEREASAQNETLLNGYSEQFSELTKSLTGQHMPLPVENCRNAKPNVMVKCLQDVKSNMENWLAGSTSNSAVTILIRGTKTNVPPVKCVGVNGCIAKLQNLSTNLRRDIQKVQKYSNDYKTSANQKIEAFTSRMAQSFSASSKVVSDYANKLNSVLASVGVNASVNFDAVRGESLKMGPDGIYQPPSDAAGLIGSKTTPPLLDITPATFAQAVKEVGKRKSEIKESIADVQKANAQVVAQAETCKEESADKLAEGLRKNMLEFGTKNCGYLESICGNSGRQASLQSIGDAISNLGPGGPIDGSVATELAGIGDLCTGFAEFDAKFKQLKNQRAEAQTKVDSLNDELRVAANTGKSEDEIKNIKNKLIPAEADLKKAEGGFAEVAPKRTGETANANQCAALITNMDSQKGDLMRMSRGLAGAGADDLDAAQSAGRRKR